jgi:hypothetical protein
MQSMEQAGYDAPQHKPVGNRSGLSFGRAGYESSIDECRQSRFGRLHRAAHFHQRRNEPYDDFLTLRQVALEPRNLIIQGNDPA